jgi:hypothetical protein
VTVRGLVSSPPDRPGGLLAGERVPASPAARARSLHSIADSDKLGGGGVTRSFRRGCAQQEATVTGKQRIGYLSVSQAGGRGC